MAKPTPDARDYIRPLNMNGLQGRMLYMPSKKPGARELLVVYGHHSSLERWWGLIQNFNTYGSVTMPDLPGFGGMDSFYKIGQKPTIDHFADYMAAFIKLRYKRRRVTIVGISFGFLVATRMLQRYPDLTKKVDLVVSAAGFMHHKEFTFSKRRMLMYRCIARIASLPGVAPIVRATFLNPWVLRRGYARSHTAKHKFAEVKALPESFDAMMEAEIVLWHQNDVRTHFLTAWEFLRLDNTKPAVDVPVWHVFSASDQYFEHNLIEQHLRYVFSEYHGGAAPMKSHSVSVIATKKETASFIPPKLRKYLLRKES